MSPTVLTKLMKAVNENRNEMGLYSYEWIEEKIKSLLPEERAAMEKMFENGKLDEAYSNSSREPSDGSFGFDKNFTQSIKD